MNSIVILGASGQDGRLLGQHFSGKNRPVRGVSRAELDLTDSEAVQALLDQERPAELYYLAAHRHSSEDHPGESDAELFRRSLEVNVQGVANVLEAIRRASAQTRLFYAGSSHVFGLPEAAVQSESTPFNPTCVYGITKAAGIQCCRYYRDTHGVFAAAGILFNHVSPYSPLRFISRKIIHGALAIASGKQDRLVLGDLSARVDWGFAPDYVEAMTRILALDRPDDFVVATGESHSVQEFVEIAFGLAGVDWTRHVTEDRMLIRKQRKLLVGDSSKLRAATGWQPTVGFREMIRLLFLDAQRHA